ncbi:MAG: hypothetical protein JWQ70_1842 [Aeromicrobium sp.]|nr:hypothetical protein [Aeromicrobium sp.]
MEVQERRGAEAEGTDKCGVTQQRCPIERLYVRTEIVLTTLSCSV